jgi:hypothetical protein
MDIKITAKLKGFREDWEESVDNTSLISTLASLGLVIYDICEALELDEEQSYEVMGAALTAEIHDHLSQKIITI